MNNTWLVDFGLNPQVNYTGNTNDAANYLYDPDGRLKTVTGIRGETISFDAEGNIQNDSN